MTQGAPEDYLPEVSLYFRPEDLTNQELGSLVLAQESDEDPRHAVHHGLVASQLWMSRNLSEELIKGTIKYDQSSIAVAADTLWQIYFPVFQRATGPALASAYIRALAQAKAGQVDNEVIYALANEHAKRMGDYFHETSRDAMIDGFNAYVNRKVPARAAAEQAMAGYGLTRKQMSGLVAMEPQKAVHSSLLRDIKSKVRAYITTSLRQRFRIFSLQEEHNLEQQAQQFAWMWMVDKGKLDPRTEKVWFTAKDERVCPICGPLHGQAVPVGEQFVTPDGEKFWVPGVHVNCRCWMKTRVPRRVLESVSKADDDWEPKEHPRGGNPRNRGQFSRAPRKVVGVAERTTTNQGFDRIMRDLAARTLPVEEADEHVEVTPKYEPVLRPTEPVNRFNPVNWRDNAYQPVLRDEPEPPKTYQPVAAPQTYSPVATPQTYTPINAEQVNPYLTVEAGKYSPVPMDAPKPAPAPAPKSGGRAVPDTFKLPIPVYTTLGPSDLMPGSYQWEFDHPLKFHTNKMQALADAEDLRGRLIEHTFNEKTQDGTVDMTVSTYNPVQGQGVLVKIKPSDLRVILETLARYAADDMEGRDDYIALDHYTHDGEWLGQYQTSISALGGDMDVDPADLAVAVIEVEEVHDGPRGNYAYVSGPGPGKEKWSVSGQYETHGERHEAINHRMSTPIYTVQPFDPTYHYVDD